MFLVEGIYAERRRHGPVVWPATVINTGPAKATASTALTVRDRMADMIAFTTVVVMDTKPQSSLRITERQVEDMTVLVLTGEMTVDDGDIVFGSTVDGLLAKGARRIVLDLAGVTYIDSAGVGMMVAEQKIVQGKGGVMKLAGLTNRSNRLLSMMRLSTVFEIYDDEAAALRSFVWRAGTEPKS